MSEGNITSMAWAVVRDTDPRLHDTVIVDQLPPEFWAEGLAIRPNGDALVVRLDEPQMWASPCASSYSAETDFEPELIHTFANASGSTNICPLIGTEREEYAVNTGLWDLSTGQFSDWVIWRVVMPKDKNARQPEEISKIVDISTESFLMGFEALSKTALIVADSIGGSILRVDLETGKTSTVLTDPALKPAEGTGNMFGVSRVRLLEKFCFVINTGSGKLFRFPIARENDTIVPTGPIEELASGFTHADGLVLSRDGKTAYVCSFSDGDVWRVVLDGEGGAGEATTIHMRGDLTATTAMDLVYHEDNDKPTLHILCNPKLSENFIDGEKGQWKNLSQVDTTKFEINVTVTTEVTYEYI